MPRVGTVSLIVISAALAASLPGRTKETCEYHLSSSSGVVTSRASEFTQEFCKWTIVPQEPSSKFLVKVQSATLPPNANLIVYNDENEIMVNRDCENCIDPIVTSAIKILLQRTDNATFHFLPKFNVSYEEFRESECAAPAPLKNGQVIGDKFLVGNTILFDCHAPFYLVGDSIAKCTATKSSPIPKWSIDFPVCAVPKCQNHPIKLSATTRWRSISNPGFENGQVESMQNCVWSISTLRKDQQLRARFHFVDLSTNGSISVNETLKILIYDGSTYNLMFIVTARHQNKTELTTHSNRMIVKFHTGTNVPLGASGFIMNYSSVSIQCPDLESPVNGSIFPKRKSYGLNDSIKIKCNDGYSVNGSSKLHCTIPGEWSGVLGVCSPHKLEAGGPEKVTKVYSIESLNDIHNNTQIKDYGPFFIKNESFADDMSSAVEQSPVGDNIEEGRTTVLAENATEMYNIENFSAVYNRTQIKDYDPFSIKNHTSTQTNWEITIIEKHTTKPNKFTKKKGYFITKSAITKPSRKPSLLYNFTRNRPKPQTSKYNNRDKYRKDAVKEQELYKVTEKPTPRPFAAERTLPLASTESLDTIGSHSRRPAMNTFINAELVIIVSGITIPILLAIIILLIFVIYRRYYPVRMGLGRKFATFENPMYERRSPPRDFSPESQHLNES